MHVPSKLFTRLVVALVLLTLFGVVVLAYSLYRGITRTVPNSYAVEWTGGLIIDYLKTHDDHWPSSWDDLRPGYDRSKREGYSPQPFEEIQQRVVVRWDVDIAAFARRDPAGIAKIDPPVRLRSGTNEHWAGHEANEMIYTYLHRDRSAAATRSSR